MVGCMTDNIYELADSYKDTLLPFPVQLKSGQNLKGIDWKADCEVFTSLLLNL